MQIQIEGALELANNRALQFSFQKGGVSSSAFLIRRENDFYAYINKCAHIPVPLDYGDGEFYDDRVDAIVCKLHGACFKVDSGYCFAGPCMGEFLDSIEISQDEQGVYYNGD